ncbi:MAG: hypothetical protein ACIAQZ_09140 [Sedimentisphaeraceae bacterium JB056]
MKIVIFIVVFLCNICLAQRPKASFKVLFSNDFTNISSCVSPYHEKGQQWSPDILKATVDETAGTGIQVHMLQPAHGWVPWWPSEVYPMTEHYEWWKEYFGVDIPKYPEQEYVLYGGDPLKVFVDKCRKDNLKPFISFRMNDGHHLENINKEGNKTGAHAICKFYAEHPEYRIGDDVKSWDEHVQNWAVSEVRAYKFKLLREICENYDIAGLELDFMRHFSLFQLDKTTSAQRRKIMTGFIATVRSLLDKTSRDGKYRWLCVRVPCYLYMHDMLGVDLAAWTKAGVDMVNLSPHYFTVFDSDIGEIAKRIPDYPVYLEMCHTTYVGKSVAKGYDSFTFRRTTPEQYYTAAHLAYSRGAAGISAFNFVYYREHGNGERGPFSEPPFFIFEHIGDPDWVAQQPQDYVLAKNWLRKKLLKFDKSGDSQNFKMDMAPTRGGWKTDGKLRMQAVNDLLDSVFTAKANGIILKPAGDVSEPYPNPYSPLLGDESVHRGWIVPKEILEDGVNEFEIIMKTGGKTTVDYINLAIK